MGHESEHAEPVVDRNDDDSLRGHTLAVVAWLGAVAGNESAAVEINKHRESVAIRFGGSPDIQIKAILAHAVRSKSHVVKDRRLHAAWAEVDRLFDTFPVLHRLRLAPAQVTYWWLSERNAAEDAHAGTLRAASFNN